MITENSLTPVELPSNTPQPVAASEADALRQELAAANDTVTDLVKRVEELQAGVRYIAGDHTGYKSFNHFCPGESGSGEWSHRSYGLGICGYCKCGEHYGAHVKKANTRSMTVSDLIKHVGDDNVQIQNLQENLTSAVMNPKCGKITFTTEPSKVLDLDRHNESEWIGLVVWIPRARVPDFSKLEAPQPDPLEQERREFEKHMLESGWASHELVFNKHPDYEAAYALSSANRMWKTWLAARGIKTPQTA